MIKAVFLDMDETICDTKGADIKALIQLKKAAAPLFQNAADIDKFADLYINGIYKELSDDYKKQLLPIIDECSFRLSLIRLILRDLAVPDLTNELVQSLQSTFDEARKQAYDFYPGISELLLSWQKKYKLVVITNGPEYSQLLKIEAVHLERYVDHIIIGGQEKEEKPAASIFYKALDLVKLNADEVVHVGDKLTTDVVGANGVGIRSVWISHGRRLHKDNSIKPDYILSRPSEMAQLIHDLSR